MQILLLSPWNPYPPDNGAKTRVYNLTRCLAQDHDVTLVTFSDGSRHVNPDGNCTELLAVNRTPLSKSWLVESLRFFSPYPIVSFRIRSMSRLVNSIMNKKKYSAAISFTSLMAPYIVNNEIPKVLDIDASLTNFAVERFSLEHAKFGKLRAWVSLQKTKAFERRMVEKFDTTVVLTEESYNSLKPILSKARKLEIIGNGVDLDYLQGYDSEQELDPYTLIYPGALTFIANYDAMQWFLEFIFPLIKAEIPSVALRITGNLRGVNLSPLYIGENVVLTGYLQDIRPAIRKSCVCIVPIRIGGGQRMKILESMALGTPVVATSKGAEGLEVQSGRHILIADTPEAFTENILRIFREPGLRKYLAENAYQLIREKYDWSVVMPRFLDLVESIALV